MSIRRKTEQELHELMEYFPAVAITGPRQVGKTTFAKTYLDGDKGIYLDLELPDHISRLDNPSLYFRENADKLIILDEIQRMPELFPVLRGIIDEDRRPGRFLLLGSASPGLIRDSSESLAGRIAYKEMFPFLLTETGVEHIQQLWLRGGFPLSFLAATESQSMLWRRNFIQTYLERDLPLLGLQASPVVIRTLWTMLAHSHGSLLNAQMISRSLGVTSPTVSRYLDFLEGAFLIHRLPPFHINLKKRLVKAPKVYIRDSGVLHALLGIPEMETLASHPVIGTSWEGFVIEQIRGSLPDGYETCFYRTHEGTECDLLITKSGVPHISIEIKNSASPSIQKGFKIAIDDLKTSKNYVIARVTEDYYVREDIVVCGLGSFLEKYLPG